MTTIDRAVRPRRLYFSPSGSDFHDPAAPAATAVIPTVVVAVRWLGGRRLIVRRYDSGCQELPGGRIEVGESAPDAVVRRTAEAAGVRVLVTGIAALFTDPGLVIRSPGGDLGQRWVVVSRARCVGARPAAITSQTSDAAQVAVADMPGLPMEPSTRAWTAQAVTIGEPPSLG